MSQFISEKIKYEKIKKETLNLIIGGTGSGKTFACLNYLPEKINVPRCRILFVSSRTMAIEQLYENNFENVGLKIYKANSNMETLWSNPNTQDKILSNKIYMMSYNNFIRLISDKAVMNYTLSNIDVVILDEVHTIISDRYIDDMGAVISYLTQEIPKGNKTFIGLTATPEILYHKDGLHASFTLLTEGRNITYKASNLVVTTYETVPHLITNRLDGKTIVMAYSIEQCKKIKESLPCSINSRLLFSHLSSEYKQNLDDMKNTREHVIKNGTLPDGCDVLITTSCLREGFSFYKESNIKNVITLWVDPLHVIQFLGRCRFDVEYLVCAKTSIYSQNFDKTNYFKEYRAAFDSFFNSSNRGSLLWFNSIKDILVSQDIWDVKIYNLNELENYFVNYINEKYLIPVGTPKKDILEKYAIYREEQKKDILNMAIQCKIVKKYLSDITFNAVIKSMTSLGYTIENKRDRVWYLTDSKSKTQVRYKQISQYDIVNVYPK